MPKYTNAILIVAAGARDECPIGRDHDGMPAGHPGALCHHHREPVYRKFVFWKQAGAQPGDVIVNINGYEMYTDKDLSFALAMADPTDTRVTVQRDGRAWD